MRDERSARGKLQWTTQPMSIDAKLRRGDSLCSKSDVSPGRVGASIPQAPSRDLILIPQAPRHPGTQAPATGAQHRLELPLFYLKVDSSSPDLIPFPSRVSLLHSLLYPPAIISFPSNRASTVLRHHHFLHHSRLFFLLSFSFFCPISCLCVTADPQRRLQPFSPRLHSALDCSNRCDSRFTRDCCGCLV